MSEYLIGVDFHCKYQRVAWVNRESGETDGVDLYHDEERKVKEFYEQFPPGTVIGMEAGGYSWWFESLMEELGHNLRLGHPGTIARKRVSRHRNDRRDAEHVLGLLVRDDFPEVWRCNPKQREQKKVIRYRVKLVRERSRWINTLRALVYNFNLQIKRGHLSLAARERIRQLRMGEELESLRDELLERITQLDTRIRELEGKISAWAHEDSQATRLMTMPGMGVNTSL